MAYGSHALMGALHRDLDPRRHMMDALVTAIPIRFPIRIQKMLPGNRKMQREFVIDDFRNLRKKNKKAPHNLTYSTFGK